MLYVHWKKVEKLDSNIEEHTFGDRIWVVCKETKNEIPTCKRRSYRVKIDMSSLLACCECRHLINLYDNLNIKDIPQQFILVRWRKDVKRKYTMIKVSYHDPSKTEEVMDYDKMIVIFDPVCLKAAHYRSIGVVVEALQLLDIRIDEDFAMKNTTTTLVNKGKASGTPSSVGNNIVGHVVTPGSVCENGKSPADEGS